jgi:hypothetical protein
VGFRTTREVEFSAVRVDFFLHFLLLDVGVLGFLQEQMLAMRFIMVAAKRVQNMTKIKSFLHVHSTVLSIVVLLLHTKLVVNVVPIVRQVGNGFLMNNELRKK